MIQISVKKIVICNFLYHLHGIARCIVVGYYVQLRVMLYKIAEMQATLNKTQAQLDKKQALLY